MCELPSEGAARMLGGGEVWPQPPGGGASTLPTTECFFEAKEGG